MHRFFVPQLYNETMTIEGVDARHISKVLRMQPGAQLQIVSDDGVSALAESVRLTVSALLCIAWRSWRKAMSRLCA